jgi:hypothetical protein
MINGFRELLTKQLKTYAEKEILIHNESINKLLNAAFEKGLVGEG